MVLLYKDNLLLAFLLTIGYGISVPALQAVIDSLKIKKLKNEYCSITKEIKEIKKQLYSRNLTEKERQKEVLFTSYPPLKITEETRRAVLEHPELHSRCSIRVRMGKFYTDEEYEQRREEVLSKPLPGDEKKRYTRKRKR